MNNIDQFNTLTGLLFSELYQSFPVPLVVSGPKFIEEVVAPDDDEGAFNFNELFDSTVDWLDESGYLVVRNVERVFGGPAEYTIVLSAKGFEVLKAAPASIEGSESLGERIVSVASDKAIDGLGSLVSLAVSTGVQIISNQ